MTRRVGVGILLVALMAGGGRWIRAVLLDGAPLAEAEPAFLLSLLPVAAAPEPERERPRRPTGPVPINVVDADSLLCLPGIGPVLAARIVEERALNGRFANRRDLQRVRGIGPRMAERLAPYLNYDDSLSTGVAARPGSAGKPLQKVDNPAGG